jgi:hypothetical protein
MKITATHLKHTPQITLTVTGGIRDVTLHVSGPAAYSAVQALTALDAAGLEKELAHVRTASRHGSAPSDVPYVTEPLIPSRTELTNSPWVIQRLDDFLTALIAVRGKGETPVIEDLGEVEGKRPSEHPRIPSSPAAGAHR